MSFLSLVYGGAVYVFFLATFLYAIAFAGNLLVPRTIDSRARGPLAEALIVSLALLGLFAVPRRTIESIRGPSRGIA